MSVGPGRPRRVLVCEDAFGYRTLVRRCMEDAGLEVVAEAESWEEAEQLAAATRPDAIVADLWMPELDVGALQRTREAAPESLVISLSGLSVEDQREVLADGAVDLVLSKRSPPDQIVGDVVALLDGADGRPAAGPPPAPGGDGGERPARDA